MNAEGGGDMLSPKVLSPMEKPVLGPVPKVGKGLRPTSSGGLRGGIRNRLEAAKLADRNISLSENLQRLSSEVEAHRRFSSRAQAESSSLEDRILALQEQLEAQEQGFQNYVKSVEVKEREWKERLAEAAHSVGVAEAQKMALQKEMKSLRSQMAKLQNKESRAESPSSQPELTLSSSATVPSLNLAKAQGPTKSRSEPESVRTLQTPRGTLSVRFDATDEEVLVQLHEQVFSLQQEAKVKDQQLDFLRGELSDAQALLREAKSQAASGDAGADTDAFEELMQGELDSMKERYDKIVNEKDATIERLEAELRRAKSENKSQAEAYERNLRNLESRWENAHQGESELLERLQTVRKQTEAALNGWSDASETGERKAEDQ